MQYPPSLGHLLLGAAILSVCACEATENNDSGTDAAVDGGASGGGLPLPARCAEPAGRYLSTLRTEEEAGSDHTCGERDSRLVTWQSDDGALATAMGDSDCSTEEVRWSDEGCTLEARISCDGEHVELRCVLTEDAAEATCEIENEQTPRCASGLWLQRAGCDWPLQVHDNICHQPCGPAERWDGWACAADPKCDGAPCGEHGRCEENVGEYTCTCDPGYRFGEGTCLVDEPCKIAGLTCDPHAFCQGEGDHARCTCEMGYLGDGLACSQATDCDSSPCGANATCEQTDAGAVCKCNLGYQKVAGRCMAQDVCIDAGLTCHAQAHCDASGPSCECAEGYEGDGSSCSDVDECASPEDVCGPHSTCNNEEGSYTCGCLEGYAREPGSDCTPANYCLALGDCTAGTTCRNVTAGFVCQCEGEDEPQVDCGAWVDTAQNEAGNLAPGVHGYWFEAPFDLRIVAARVPNVGGSDGEKVIGIYRLHTLGAPSFDADVLGAEDPTFDAMPLALDISVDEGELIGILGYDWPGSEVEPSSLVSQQVGNYTSSIAGETVELRPLSIPYDDEGNALGVFAWQEGAGDPPPRGIVELMLERR